MSRLCNRCGKVKVLGRFCRTKSWCKLCDRQYGREYRRKRRKQGKDQFRGSPEQRRYYVLLSYATREGYAGPHLSFDEWCSIWARAGGRCEIPHCGAYWDLQHDHIVPLSSGGSNLAANLRIVCARCNRARACRPMSGRYPSSFRRAARKRLDRLRSSTVSYLGPELDCT